MMLGASCQVLSCSKAYIWLWVLDKMERLITLSSRMNFEDIVSFRTNCFICFGWVSSWELAELWFTETGWELGPILIAQAWGHPWADDAQFYISTSDLYFEFQIHIHKYTFYFRRFTHTTRHCLQEKIWWMRYCGRMRSRSENLLLGWSCKILQS